MSMIDEAVERMKRLPPERQREALDFLEFLERKSSERRPRRSAKGLWAGLGVSVSKEEIDELRREMWKNFPRELEP